MGIKRLGRKRLAAIEKLGILKNVSASDAIKNAIVSATQHREGQKVVTDVVLDLGSSTAGLKTQATAEKFPIGTTTSAVSYVCHVTDAVFGVVTAVDVVCLEAISDGTLTDFDVMYATGADGTLNTEADTDVAIKTSVGAKGYQETAAYDASELTGKYIYVTSGAATGQVATATIDCSEAVHGNMTTAVDTIRLLNSAGTAVNFISADSGNHDDAGADLTIKIGGMTSAADLAQAISRGINANTHFSTDADSRAGSSTSVIVSHAVSTITNNQTNYLLNDDPQASNGITVGAFTGGIDDGQAMASGKLLLRFTGFMAFDDV